MMIPVGLRGRALESLSVVPGGDVPEIPTT